MTRTYSIVKTELDNARREARDRQIDCNMDPSDRRSRIVEIARERCDRLEGELATLAA